MRSPGAIAALVVTLAIVLIAVAPGRWGTAHGQTAGVPAPPPPEPVRTSAEVDGTLGGAVLIENAGDASVGVTIPAGTSDTPLTIEFVPLSFANLPGGGDLAGVVLPPAIPPLPLSDAGPLAAVSVFELNLTAGGRAVDLRGTAIIDVTLPPEVMALSGGLLTNIRIARFDASVGAWQVFIVVPGGALPPAAGSCVPVSSNALRCGTDAFSVWAIAVLESAIPAPTLQAAAPSPPNTGAGPAATGGNGGASLLAITALLALAAGAALGGRRLTR